jgi:NADP-dependent aldehyde dehydrogenase
MSISITGKNFIGGELSAAGKASFRAVNPSTLENISPDFFESTSGETDDAVRKAAQAFEIYRSKTGHERADFLDAVAAEIEMTGDELIKRCMEETGLPEARLNGERARTVNQLRLFSGLLREGSWVEARIDPAEPERKPLPRPDIRSMLRPIGPVGIFGASNFPLAFSVAGGDTASALAAGCPVVFKAHPSHPGTSEIVAAAIQRAIGTCKMPEGVFSLIHGASVDVGLTLVRHPMIKAIGFTGSFRGGKAIFDEANKRETPIPVYAEMGSSNPVFILPGILRAKGNDIARDLVASVSLGVGQFCTNPGLVVLEDTPDTQRFRAAVADNFKSVNAGIMLNQNIQRNYDEGVRRLSDSGVVEVTAQGINGTSGCAGTAYFMETTGSAFLENRSLEEEVFGPSTLAVSTENKAQLLRIADDLHGHLTATVHGTEEDLADYTDLIQILEQKVGRIIINGYPTGVEVCHAMVHGGPYPATTDSRTTSVGTQAIKRFCRAVCYQGFPESLLPPELKPGNPLGIFRLSNGSFSKE